MMEGRSYEYARNSLSRGTKTPLSPADSVMSIGQFRPSLVCLFNQLRQEDRDALTKEDLRQLLGGSVDTGELDSAFEKLDMDNDGEISLDEFLAGFAQFLKEAPRTPALREHRKKFTFSPVHRYVPARRKLQEDFFETQPQEEMAQSPGSGPSEAFTRSLRTLSAHNSRQSIEALWYSLADTNPELMGDFEEFVGEIANEVEVAQSALNKQRLATKQEALQLDEEIESRLSDAHSRLEIQTALVREQARAKLEKRLTAKETELIEVKHKLEELRARLEACCRFALQLESEVVEGQRTHFQLEQHCHELLEEKQKLESRLEVSEAKLERTQSEMFTLHQQQAAEHNGIHSSHLEEKEAELTQIKQEYEREIVELREKLGSYHMHQTLSDTDDELSWISEATPDLLATMTERQRRPSRSSLLDEILQQEGMASPILRGEPLMHPLAEIYPVLNKRTSLSLPNLARTSRPDVAMMHTPAVYVPVYVGSHRPQPLPTIRSPDSEAEEQEDERGERAPPEGRVTPPLEVLVTPPPEDDVYEPVEVSGEEEESYLDEAQMLLCVQVRLRKRITYRKLIRN